jgi:N-acetylmuramoyl-L-alanine amidase
MPAFSAMARIRRLPPVRAAWLAAVLALLLALPLGAQWNVEKIGDRDYLAGRDVKAFYSFTQYVVNGNTATFQMPGFWMRAHGGSKELTIKGLKFVMSFPAVRRGEEIFFSRTDLVKLIDPVLRPDYIKGLPDFDTVVLDPGHGGQDSGARGPHGLEKDIALKTALRAAALLRARGFKVVLTRSTDTFVTLENRVAIANRHPRAVFVSIHFNHASNRAARGIETFALAPVGTISAIDRWPERNLGKRRGNSRDAENIALATAVQNSVLRRLELARPVDRGVKRARFSVISGITVPGILFEGGFVAHAEEGKLLVHPTYQQMLAEGLVRGIENYRRALQK